jgi:hypothetical protein
MLGRTGFIAIAVISAVVGAHSLNPRELYNEMYPVETIKRDAFHICGDADPTFVRAVGADREACYDSMPHVIAVALGRVKPGGALSTQATIDPSREAELLMTLAAVPPRQPITARRSFADTAWTHALPAGCDDRAGVSAAGDTVRSGLPLPPGTDRAAALDKAILPNLPPLPRTAQAGLARHEPLPVIPLVDDKAAAAPGAADNKRPAASFAPLPAPDIGDLTQPAIVPLVPGRSCDGA